VTSWKRVMILTVLSTAKTALNRAKKWKELDAD